MPSRRRCFSATLAGAALLYCAFPAVVTASPSTSPSDAYEVQVSAIDPVLQAASAKYHLASITAEVRKNGKVIYAKSLGHADLQNDIPATPQSLYAIGSITKSLTSYCILSLVESGQLTLSTQIGEVLPDYTGPSRDVTILQMLTHTSGLPDNAGDSSPALFDDPARNFTKQEVVDQFKEKPLVFAPGTRWQYSNSTYYLLSLVIEKLTGRTYDSAVEELLLKPFGLDHIVLGQRDRIIRNRVSGYTIDADGQIRNASTWDAALPLGAGAYLSSADDLTRYVATLFGDSVSPEIRRMMFNKVSLADGTQVNYLPAAFVESDFYGHPKLAHAGGIWGFLAFVAYYPRDKVAITVLVNTDSAIAKNNVPVASLERKLARIVHGIPQGKVDDLPLSLADAQNFVGTYLLPELLPSGDAVKLSYSNNRLFMTVGPRPTYIVSATGTKSDYEPAAHAIPLMYQGNGRFLKQDDDEVAVTMIRHKANHVDVQLEMMGWPLIGKFAGDSPTPMR